MGFLRPFAGFIIAAGLIYADSSAAKVYEQGQIAERDGRIVQAYMLYERAAQMDPKNQLYSLHAQALKSIANTKSQPAATAPQPEEPGSASGVTGTITNEDLRAAETLKEPPRLNPRDGSKSFSFKSDPKAIWEKVADAFGLFVIFDKDYAPNGQIKFDLADSNFKETIRALEDATGTFAVPLSDRVMLVAQDTTQKRTDLETNEALAIPIPERTSVQEAQELVTAIQQTMEIRRIVVDPTRHMVFARDRVSKIEAARALLAELMHPKPQVDIQVELLSVSENSSLSFGLNLPTQFPLVNFGNVWKNASISVPTGFTNFLTFGGGASFIGIGITNAKLFANASKSSAQSIIKSDLVVVDGQAGSMHVGDKYPIVTASYLGSAFGSTNGSQYYTPPPQVNFEDLGVVLKITPVIHGPDEVSLDVEAEYKVLGNGSFNGIPVISTRKFQAKVRLRTTEWAVVTGLMNDTQTETKDGIPGLMHLPLIGRLFRQNTKTHDSTQTLLVIKPRVITLPPSEWASREFWVGTETRPQSPL